MSLKVESLLKKQRDFCTESVGIQWALNLQRENEVETINKTGNYTIKTHYYPGVHEIDNARTIIDSYYIPFHELVFIDEKDESNFTLLFNRVVTVDMEEQNLKIEFLCHSSSPLYAFNLDEPVISGTAVLSTKEEHLNEFIDILSSNLLIGGEYPILRCERCQGLMTVDGAKDPNDPLYDTDFICMDCYNACNNFFNILESEIQMADKETIKNQRMVFLQYIDGGMDVSLAINDNQLKRFYDALVVRIELISGEIDSAMALKLLNKYLDIAKLKGYKKLNDYLNDFITSLTGEPPHDEKHNVEIGEVGDSLPEVEEKALEGLSSQVSESITEDLALKNQDLDSLSTDDLLSMSSNQLLSNLSGDSIGSGSPSLETKESSAEDIMLSDMADAIMVLSSLESDLEPKPISPIDKLKTANEELTELKEKAKPSAALDELPELDVLDFGLIDESAIDEEIGKKAYSDIWEDVEEGISALNELLPEKDKEEKLVSNSSLEASKVEGANQPPGLKPPPGANPPPGLKPPPGANQPPGLKPPPGANQPPGLK
ncbi:MAG: hypothetical protein GF364_06090, partial [Candidatus Lokiarchaeota archaeon]|nr:hypothetical protein [Candidatus Lokiarchaeota archaeon]